MKEQMRLLSLVALPLILGLVLLTSGCASYYVVNDPETGRTYYTTEWDTVRGGATPFLVTPPGERPAAHGVGMNALEEERGGQFVDQSQAVAPGSIKACIEPASFCAGGVVRFNFHSSA